jgi:hypothetical protein
VLIEDYKKLIEAQSLQNYIHKHQQLIQEHQQRLQKLKDKISNSQTDLESFENELVAKRQELSIKEKESFSLGTKLETAQARASSLANEQQIAANEGEINSLCSKLEVEEEEAFALLEDIESLEEKLTDTKSFLAGAKETLSEIKEEVEKDIQKEEREITNYKKRIDLLLLDVETKLSTRFLEVQKKTQNHEALAYIVKDSCSGCRIQISKAEEDAAERALSVVGCSSCGRLLVPRSARN